MLYAGNQRHMRAMGTSLLSHVHSLIFNYSNSVNFQLLYGKRKIAVKTPDPVDFPTLLQ